MELSQFQLLSRELRRRVMLMIGRAVLTVVNDATRLQTVQVEGLPDEIIDGAERFQAYGLTSHPLPGADALVLAVGGIRQHPVILIDDRRYRVRELAEGEVCLYTDEDLLDAKQPDESNEDQDPALPHRIVMKRGRIIEMRCGASSIVMSPSGIELRVTDGTTTSLLTLTATDIDAQAGDGAHVLLDTNVDIDGTRIDLN